MRAGSICIDGETHVLCFSVRVVRACTERYGSVAGIDDALSSDDPIRALDESLWILSEMMRAGAKYATEHGMENAKAMSVDELYDHCDIHDLAGIKASLVLTISNGAATNVKVESSPNVKATQGM